MSFNSQFGRPNTNKKRIDLTGKQLGNFECIEYVDSQSGMTRWRVKCAKCGVRFVTASASLRSGSTACPNRCKKDPVVAK